MVYWYFDIIFFSFNLISIWKKIQKIVRFKQDFQKKFQFLSTILMSENF